MSGSAAAGVPAPQAPDLNWKDCLSTQKAPTNLSVDGLTVTKLAGDKTSLRMAQPIPKSDLYYFSMKADFASKHVQIGLITAAAFEEAGGAREKQREVGQQSWGIDNGDLSNQFGSSLKTNIKRAIQAGTTFSASESLTFVVHKKTDLWLVKNEELYKLAEGLSDEELYIFCSGDKEATLKLQPTSSKVRCLIMEDTRLESEETYKQILAETAKDIKTLLHREREIQAKLTAITGEVTAKETTQKNIDRYAREGDNYWELLCRNDAGKRLSPHELAEASQTFAGEAQNTRINPDDGQTYTKEEFEAKYDEHLTGKVIKEKWAACKQINKVFVFSASGHPPTRWAALIIGLKRYGIPHAALFEEDFKNWQVHFGAAVERLLEQGLAPVILYDDKQVIDTGDYTDDALGKAQKEELDYWKSVENHYKGKDVELKKMTFSDFFYDILGYRKHFADMLNEFGKHRDNEHLCEALASSDEQKLTELLHLANMLYTFSNEGKEFTKAVTSFRDRCRVAAKQLTQSSGKYEQIIEKNKEIIKVYTQKMRESKEQAVRCQRLGHTLDGMLPRHT